jgi:hypothetical protein
MPRKAKPILGEDTVSVNLSQPHKQRGSGSRGKQPVATDVGSTAQDAVNPVVVHADPTGGLAVLDPHDRLPLPEHTVRPMTDTPGSLDLIIPEIEPLKICVRPLPNVVSSEDLPEPRSAWFLFGSQDSLLTDDDLMDDDGSSEWNCPKHVEIGDVLFFYFKAPYKAVHFVARAISEPYPGEDGWHWLAYDCMVRIEPISITEIRKIFDDKRLLMYCKDGRYIRPDFANRLLERAKVAFSPFDSANEKALEKVVGKKELGDPNTITLDGLRSLKSADFISEEPVEYHFVEPLLRLAELDKHARIQRKYDLPRRKTADYAALDRAQKALCIIEVKLRLGERKEWKRSSEFLQAREYANESNAPAFSLIDCDRVFCFQSDSDMPCLTLNRNRLSNEDLCALRAHILGDGRTDATTRRRR